MALLMTLCVDTGPTPLISQLASLVTLAALSVRNSLSYVFWRLFAMDGALSRLGGHGVQIAPRCVLFKPTASPWFRSFYFGGWRPELSAELLLDRVEICVHSGKVFRRNRPVSGGGP